MAAALPPIDSASLTVSNLNSSVYCRFGTCSFFAISFSVHQKVTNILVYVKPGPGQSADRSGIRHPRYGRISWSSIATLQIIYPDDSELGSDLMLCAHVTKDFYTRTLTLGFGNRLKLAYYNFNWKAEPELRLPLVPALSTYSRIAHSINARSMPPANLDHLCELIQSYRP